MPRPKQNLEIVTMRLTRGAASRLQEYYPALGYNKVVRHLVDIHLEFLERQAAQLAKNKPDDDENLRQIASDLVRNQIINSPEE